MALTPDGARRLRIARDHIVAHPEEFDMSTFQPDCGTACCIGGHILQELRREGSRGLLYSAHAIKALGFGETDSGPIVRLFYGDLDINDPVHHAKRIDALLWQFGYPPNEIAQQPESELQPELSPVLAHPAVREGR